MSVDERAEIERAIRSIFENFQAGNIHGLESMLADDCTVWDVFTPEFIVGKEARREFHAADKAQSQARGALTWNTRFVRVDVWGDLALACYYLDFEYQEPGAMTGSVRTSDLLRRQDGKWIVIHHHEGLVPISLDAHH